MNDEQFEQEQLDRDNGYKKTLERVEAELAAALALISEAKDELRTGPSYGWEDRLASKLGAFLAQAEQQEARPVSFYDAIKNPPRIAPTLQQEAQRAQAGEFQREDRYIVIKRKDLVAADMAGKLPSGWYDVMVAIGEAVPNRKCLVIESDWPEYEPTWAAIQARVTGQAGEFWAWPTATAARVKVAISPSTTWKSPTVPAPRLRKRNRARRPWLSALQPSRHAFDYSAAPIGSRDWTLYWKGWIARAALATQPAEQWIACSDRLPDVSEGCQQEFIVCAKRNQSGKLVVMSALYLNAYPLYCDHDDEAADEDGNIPHTGWYDAKSNGDDANCYSEIDDSRYPYGAKVTHWMSLPQPAAVRGAEHE